jgi:hypothetical protein
MNVMKSGHGVRRANVLTGQIYALRQIPETAKTLAGPEALPARLKQAGRGLVTAMCTNAEEIGCWGKTGSRTLVIENAAITNASRATIVHRDTESFIASVAPQLDRWASAMANRLHKNRTNAGEAYRREAYDRMHATLSAQLEEARTNGDMQTRYTEIYELTAEALETANALRSAIAVSALSGDKEKAAVYSRRLDALVASDDAWMPHLLWTQRTSRREATAGLRFGVYAEKTDAVSSSSIKTLG